MLRDRDHWAAGPKALRVESLSKEASVAREEEVALGRAGRGWRVHRVRIRGDQGPVFVRIDRSDANPVGGVVRSAREVRGHVEEVTPVRQERGVAMRGLVARR